MRAVFLRKTSQCAFVRATILNEVLMVRVSQAAAIAVSNSAAR